MAPVYEAVQRFNEGIQAIYVNLHLSRLARLISNPLRQCFTLNQFQNKEVFASDFFSRLQDLRYMLEFPPAPIL